MTVETQPTIVVDPPPMTPEEILTDALSRAPLEPVGAMSPEEAAEAHHITLPSQFDGMVECLGLDDTRKVVRSQIKNPAKVKLTEDGPEIGYEDYLRGTYGKRWILRGTGVYEVLAEVIAWRCNHTLDVDAPPPLTETEIALVDVFGTMYEGQDAEPMNLFGKFLMKMRMHFGKDIEHLGIIDGNMVVRPLKANGIVMWIRDEGIIEAYLDGADGRAYIPATALVKHFTAKPEATETEQEAPHDDTPAEASILGTDRASVFKRTLVAPGTHS